MIPAYPLAYESLSVQAQGTAACLFAIVPSTTAVFQDETRISTRVLSSLEEMVRAGVLRRTVLDDGRLEFQAEEPEALLAFARVCLDRIGVQSEELAA
jgi:hypothetical protein